MTNREVAEQLLQLADELQHNGEMLYRVRSLRTAAYHIQHQSRSLEELFTEQGRAGLEAVPGIGRSLAYTVEKLLVTGDVRTLRPLQCPPDRQLRNLPGIGHRLAERLLEQDIASIEQLADAMDSGRLTTLGIPARQQEGLRRVLADRNRPATPPLNEPSLDLLLTLDREFRQQSLPLPLCGQRDGWRFRVRLANTAIAHRRGKANDWVLIDFEKDGHKGQRTVVTQEHGEWFGQRVVRGREVEQARRKVCGAA
jgi:hypothetical protein